jgi:hypothetical protein
MEVTMKAGENVHDKRFVKLENVMAANYIPFMEGRPQRDECICKNDLLDLKIMLNQLKSVEEFAASL